MRSIFVMTAGLGLAVPTAFSQTQTSAPAGSVQTMNPDISLNFLTLYKSAKREGAKKTEEGGGFALQEAEIQFNSNVDAYFKAVATFGIHPEEHEEEAHASEIGTEEVEVAPEEQHYGIDPEEIYLETISLPNVTLKLGRFHADLGRHNKLHAHAYPFVDAPIINQRLLGDEGLIENGLSASVLVPLPWFMEVTAQALQGDSPALFSSQSSTDIASVYRVRNLWDLSDAWTIDLGVSGAQGSNAWNGKTKVHGADLSLKWRPVVGGKYQSLSLAYEYLAGEIENRPEEEKLSGYASWLQYQASQRVWLQVRTEEAKSQDEGAKKHKKLSALIGFNPTEFSGIRMQYDQLHDNEEKPLNTFLVQGNITIGAHPAHTY